MFGQKNESEKILKKIKKKQNKINKLLAKNTERCNAKAEKLMEELRKMVRLGIKDGKLQPIEEVPMQQPVQQQTQQTQQQNDPFVNTWQQPQMQQAYQQPVQEPMYQQPLQEQQYQPPQPQQMYQQLIPPMQMVQPIQPPPLPQQQYVEPAIINITLMSGKMLPVKIAQQELEQFLDKIGEAIDNQSSLQLGTKVINGRYIVEFDF